MSKSHLEDKFKRLWHELYPDIELTEEYRFCIERRFRFDFAHLPSKVAIEINGGTWVKSKHSSGAGIERDYTKNNLAVWEGWRVFQLSRNMINCESLSMIYRTIVGVPDSR